jgi:hypothetical protein
MKLLKAIEKQRLGLVAVLEFDKPFNHTDFSFGILSLSREGRSLYLDVTESRVYTAEIGLSFEYDEDILAEGVSRRADLKVQDLLLGLDEAELYIGEEDYVTPTKMTLFVEGSRRTALEINLTID